MSVPARDGRAVRALFVDVLLILELGVVSVGLPGDIPVAVDFDGDWKTDSSAPRPSTGEWFVRFSGLNYSYSTWVRFGWGIPGDIPVAADFDGDGRADVAVFRPSNGGCTS